MGEILDEKTPLQATFLREIATLGASSSTSTASRKRRIDTGSKSLDAEFDLLGLLSIQSQSGSVKISIHPKPAYEANPVPAEVQISSHYGSIGVNFDNFSVLERDYYVSIDSHSGSITGNILHGRRTSITTESAKSTRN